MRDLLPLKLLLLAAIGCPATPPDDSADTADTADTAESAPCADPESILLASGEPSGFERCADGAVNRVEALPFPGVAPADTCLGTEDTLACETAADCAAAPYGACLHRSSPDAGDTSCGCSYSCGSDADCLEGYACIPTEVRDGADYASCEPAFCLDAGDCASGECGLSNFDNGCGYADILVCRDDGDTCHGDGECTEVGESCDVNSLDDGFACVAPDCDIGRPLLVDGAARVAPAAARADWALALAPELPAAHRAALAAHWATVAALEHASVGSFARFTLQLLALGAPPELVRDTQRAAVDEIDHARFAYGLASAYAGAPVGPGGLPLDGAMPALDVAGFVRGLCHEACVGETLGAAEAAEAAAGCADPAVRAGLERIAADEADHAALAWRALSWACRAFPEARAVARAELAVAVADHERRLAGVRASEPALGRWGAPAPRDRAAAQRRAIAQVVGPVMAGLLAHPEAPEGGVAVGA